MSQALNRQTANQADAYPIRILQFGGGNFLRGFVDWMIDIYNEKSGANLGISVAKVTERGDYSAWREQDGLYHLITRGIEKGEVVDRYRLVNSISEIRHTYNDWRGFLETAEREDMNIIISNTTENGIRTSESDKLEDQPPHEFPAKLTRWLYHRYEHFNGDKDAGCYILPTELIDDNAARLLSCVQYYVRTWELSEDFGRWLLEANYWCNTLVDRIVPGISADDKQEISERIGFDDRMATQGEPYHLFAIEKKGQIDQILPLDKVGLNVIYADDINVYRTLKVRILNGLHTSMVPVGYLLGLRTVQDVMKDPLTSAFVKHILDNEIIPSISLPKEMVVEFASEVLDRFKNPFVPHKLISISLNSIAKFKSRVLPSIIGYYEKHGSLPRGLVCGLAALIRFYEGSWDGQNIDLNDDPNTIGFIQDQWGKIQTAEDYYNLASAVLGNENFWQRDLNEIAGFTNELATLIKAIDQGSLDLALASIV